MDLRPFRVLLWTAFFLLAGELALELRAQRRGWGGVLLSWVGGGGKVASTGTGEWGPAPGFPFRSPVLVPGKAEGRLRIWISSSSYGEDTRIPAPEVFPNRVPTHLASEGIDAEVLNASKAGYFIGSNLEQLRDLGPTWRPGVVLLYQMSNDIDLISETLSADRAEGQGPPGVPGAGGAEAGGEEEDEEQSISPPSGSFLDRFTEELTIYKDLKQQVTARLARGRVLRQGLGAAGNERFEDLVRRFVDEARTLGAEPVLCTFPTRFVRGEAALAGPATELQVLTINVQLSLAGWLETVAEFNGVLTRVAADEGLVLVDVAGELSGRRELFRDLWHLTAEGHDLVGAIIARGLAEARR